MKPGIRRLIEELRGARVLVVHPRDAEGDALLDQLKRIGCNVRGIWPPPVEIPGDVDTVFHLVETAETPDTLAGSVVRLLRDPQGASARGIEGRRRVAAAYNWDASLKQLLELLESPRTTDPGALTQTTNGSREALTSA